MSNSNEVQKTLLARMEELRQRNAELRRHEEHSWEKDVEILRLKAAKEELQRHTEELRQTNAQNLESRELHRKEIEALKAEIQAKEAFLLQAGEDFNRKLARISDKSWEKEIEIKTLKANQSNLESEVAVLRQLKAENEKRLAETQSQIDELKIELKAANADLRTIEVRARMEAKSATHQLLAITKERDEYVRRLEREVVELQGQVKVLTAERANVEGRIKHRTDSMAELNAQIEKLQITLRNIETNHSAEIQAIVDENRVFIARIKEKHAEALARMKTEFDSQHRSFCEETAVAAKEAAARFEEQINDLAANHSAEVEALEQIERDLMAEITRLRVESAGQTKHIEALSQQIRELKAALQEERQKVSRQEEALKTQSGQIHQLESDLRSAKDSNDKSLEDKETEKSARAKVELRLDDAISKNTELVGQLASLHEQLAMKEADLRGLKDSLSAISTESEASKAEFAEFKRSQGEAHRETHHKFQSALKEEKLKRQAEAIEWSQRLNEFQTSSAKDLATLKAERSELALQLASVKAESESNYQNFRATNSELKAERDALIVQCDSHRAEIQRQLMVIKEREAQMVTLKAEHDSRIQKVETWLEKEKATADAELTKLENKIDTLVAENASLRQALNLRNSNIEAEQREFEIRSQNREKQISEREKQSAARDKQSSVREAQLRQYASAVTEQKAELIRQTKILAEEIQMTAKFHPLKDYLQLTDFELSKAEVQLKLTPTISSDRPKLEAYVKQMVEQRDFLQKVVDESERKFAEQANAILELIRSPKLAATPPPPPRFSPKVEAHTNESTEGLLVDSPVLHN